MNLGLAFKDACRKLLLEFIQGHTEVNQWVNLSLILQK
jgi:hypothetical protein